MVVEREGWAGYQLLEEGCWARHSANLDVNNCRPGTPSSPLAGSGSWQLLVMLSILSLSAYGGCLFLLVVSCPEDAEFRTNALSPHSLGCVVNPCYVPGLIVHHLDCRYQNHYSEGGDAWSKDNALHGELAAAQAAGHISVYDQHPQRCRLSRQRVWRSILSHTF